MKITNYTNKDAITKVEKNAIVDFLFDHLDQYGDSKPAILNAMEYALSNQPMAGGFILVSREDNGEDRITGAVVMNNTGMREYIPEHILVYIAVDKGYRGKGLGKALMNEAFRIAKGNIALHVEPDNPARFLYEKLGFENKYLEMRLIHR